MPIPKRSATPSAPIDLGRAWTRLGGPTVRALSRVRPRFTAGPGRCATAPIDLGRAWTRLGGPTVRALSRVRPRFTAGPGRVSGPSASSGVGGKSQDGCVPDRWAALFGPSTHTAQRSIRPQRQFWGRGEKPRRVCARSVGSPVWAVDAHVCLGTDGAPTVLSSGQVGATAVRRLGGFGFASTLRTALLGYGRRTDSSFVRTGRRHGSSKTRRIRIRLHVASRIRGRSAPPTPPGKVAPRLNCALRYGA